MAKTVPDNTNTSTITVTSTDAVPGFSYDMFEDFNPSKNILLDPTGEASITVPVQSNFTKDQTPECDIEHAELKLAGICPACRCHNDDHTWDCKNYSWQNAITGTTINSSAQYGTIIAGGTTYSDQITIGSAVIDEDKITKLDKILELFDDDELEKLLEAAKEKKEKKWLTP